MSTANDDDEHQHPSLLRAALEVECDKDEAALDKRLKAVLTSQTATDAQVLDALDAGLQQGEIHMERSREALRNSRKVLARADEVLRK